jgi:hypothetical protein
VLQAQRTLFGRVQFDSLADQIAICDPAALGKLFLAPTIKQVSRSGLSPKTGLQLPGLALDEILSLTVAGVVDYRKVEPQTEIDVSWSRLRHRSLSKALDLPGTEEVLDRLLQLVLSQTARPGNADLFS